MRTADGALQLNRPSGEGTWGQGLRETGGQDGAEVEGELWLTETLTINWREEKGKFNVNLPLIWNLQRF